MVGTNCMDELDSGNYYDHIDDLLNIPVDDHNADVVAGSGDRDSVPSVFAGVSSSEGVVGYESVFSVNSASDLSAELAVPYEDIVQLEWLSNFVEDSFSGGGMTMEKNNSSVISSTNGSSLTQFQASSPISVLECSNTDKGTRTTHEKKARSKRPRPPTFNLRPTIQLLSPTSSSTEGDQPKKRKPKTKKAALLANPDAAAPQPLRKCAHCEITKTPQWRAGPMGPKTLCNACGVRFKSGRLFPEYRPATSPTFVPSVHSNSHKKVLELRTGEKP